MDPTRSQTLDAPPADPRRVERWSGFSLAGLMLAAFALVAIQIYEVATGPLPPGPGAVAPAFSAPSLEGESLSLEAHRGKVVLLDFWATWCPPCVASMPSLQRVHDRYGARGFTVLGVNQEPGAQAKVRGFLSRRGIAFPNVVDPGSIHSSYGVYSFPSSFLVDREGVIRNSYRGVVSEARLGADIEAILE